MAPQTQQGQLQVVWQCRQSLRASGSLQALLRMWPQPYQRVPHSPLQTLVHLRIRHPRRMRQMAHQTFPLAMLEWVRRFRQHRLQSTEQASHCHPVAAIR